MKTSNSLAPQLGARSELIACAHLLSLGYLVFRNVSQHGAFDLVAYADGVCTRVEVKTTITGTKFDYFPWPTNDEWDRIIVVDREQWIVALDLSQAGARDHRDRFGSRLVKGAA